MMNLYEKHRPEKLSQIVGQAAAVRTVKSMVRAGVGGRAFWISGISGSGKTSIARIIAGEIADPFFIEEFDAGWGLSQNNLQEISETMQVYGAGKGGRAFIVNEAHGLRKWIIQQLLGILERIPNHVVFIFTTTRQGQDGLFEDQIDAGPLLSRCIEIWLTSKGLDRAFARRCKKIAEAEGLDGQPMSAYVELARSCKCNFRTMLQKVETGVMAD